MSPSLLYLPVLHLDKSITVLFTYLGILLLKLMNFTFHFNERNRRSRLLQAKEIWRLWGPHGLCHLTIGDRLKQFDMRYH